MKNITVRGSGRVSVKPDLIVVSMELKTVDKKYDKTLENAARRVDLLNDSLEKAGFAQKSVKTTSFDVNTKYESVKDKDGKYKNVFVGYVCTQSLKIEFDFDTKMLADALSAIADSLTEPEFSVSFTVKDPSAISDRLLQSAAENARQKAQVLCSASGVKLGKLVSIDYGMNETSFVSDTNYMVARTCLKSAPLLANIDMEPDDINVKDSATFVWEIE